MPLPRFRNMDVIPIEEEGKPIFIIQDNEGLFDHTLRLPPMAFVVASLLDGVREIKGIQDTGYHRRTIRRDGRSRRRTEDDRGRSG